MATYEHTHATLLHISCHHRFLTSLRCRFSPVFMKVGLDVRSGGDVAFYYRWALVV
jgi:hypothetical protein